MKNSKEDLCRWFWKFYILNFKLKNYGTSGSI
jgi:hypothetical protein